MVRKSRARVAVKANHGSNGQVRWSSSPVTNCLYSFHCSIEEADINTKVAGEHHTDLARQMTASSPPAGASASLGHCTCLHSLDGGKGLTTGLELSHVVLDYSFDSWDGARCPGLSAGHEMVPVNNCDLGILKPEEDILELQHHRLLSPGQKAASVTGGSTCLWQDLMRHTVEG